MTTPQHALAHIVTWRMNGATPEERAAQADRTVQAFEAARHDVPGLLRMEVGRNIVASADAWDVALYMVFATLADLQAYQFHPAHLRIKALVAPMRAARGQADFEVPT